MDFSEIKTALKRLREDNATPKNVKEKASEMLECLSKDAEDNIKRDKLVQKLDEISNDINLKTITRTQIWQITSMVESLENGE